MSRCEICDYSQSADSLYYDGIAINPNLNNRVIYSPRLQKSICLSCLDEHTAQTNFWESLDETTDPVFEAIPDETDYPGCTDKQAD